MPLALRVLVLITACLLGFANPARAEPTPAVYGTERWIEYVPGELPIVLTAPHGGTLRPSSLPDRQPTEDGQKLVLQQDLNTQELARAISAALAERTGLRPHVIISLLHRRKLDPNRDLVEAATGNAGAERAWREFHGFIDQALAAAVAAHGFALLVDVHGHAHAIKRLELGYGLAAEQFARADADFDAAHLANGSTFRALASRTGTGAALLRGPHSLGALFSDRGIRAVPSPREPDPGHNPYFNGGYIVRAHTQGAEGRVDAVQIETPTPVRDTPAHRAEFAAVTAEVLLTFLREQYAFTLAADRAVNLPPAR